MELTLNSYPVPAEHARCRRLEHEAVVVLPDNGEVKVLNDVGAQIWALADGSRSVRDIVVALCNAYDVAPALAESDTLMFLTEGHCQVVHGGERIGMFRPQLRPAKFQGLL